MKKYIFVLGGALLLCFSSATGQSIEETLKSIEANNPDLDANRKMNQALSLEARTGNSLENPSVELEYLFGSRTGMGNEYELSARQSFEFPSAYFQRNKIASLKETGYTLDRESYRQQVLLDARQTILEIIYLHKQQRFLSVRYENAEALSRIYEKRLSEGDADILEYNKIQIEFLNIDTEKRLNATAIEAAMEKLLTLNGGQAVDFDMNEYPAVPPMETLEAVMKKAMEKDPSIRSLDTGLSIAGWEVSLARSLALPKFDLGYKRMAEVPGAGSLNGVVVGISIPIFESRNTVKRAKAQAAFASAQKQSSTQLFSLRIRELYQKAATLSQSVEQFRKLLKAQDSIELLRKAIEAGEISAVEYFVETGLLYQSIENFLKIENEYYDTLAELYKFEL